MVNINFLHNSVQYPGESLEKQVVRFERETTIKDDICYIGSEFTSITEGVSCDNCRVHMLTDRFLSYDFQHNVMDDYRKYPMGIYPYVIIVDTSLCNLRCRPCYSWKYWKPEPSAKATMVDPKTLAGQFMCKIQKLQDEELISHSRVGEKTKRPFSRLRISGGEPLYSNRGHSIDFWLSFFKHLDSNIGDLRNNDELTLLSEKGWKNLSSSKREELFPVFLSADNGKLRIRFDTNGWLFNSPEVAREFIGEFYALGLDNIKLDIIYSIKGTNTHEVHMMIGPGVPFDMELLRKDEKIEEHPQWKSIQNIVKAIRENETTSTIEKKTSRIISADYFNPCGEVSLTLERGIMNNPDERLYLYDRRSLNWERFGEKLREKGLRLSETQNAIYMGKYVDGKAWSYMKRGDYEIAFKCAHHGDRALITFSMKPESLIESQEHVQIERYGSREISRTKYNLNKNLGKKCKESDKKCEYWIEMIPY